MNLKSNFEQISIAEPNFELISGTGAAGKALTITTNVSERPSPANKKNKGKLSLKTVGLISPHHSNKASDFDDGVSSKDNKFAAVRQFLKKPKTSLKFVRDLPQPTSFVQSRVISGLTQAQNTSKINLQTQTISYPETHKQMSLVAGFRYEEPDVLEHQLR